MADSTVRRKIRRIRHRIGVVKQFESHAYWRSQQIRPDTVLYESFAGNGMLCNPEAIFRHLLAAPDQQHLKHVWVLSDFGRYRHTMAEFADDPRVGFVEYGSMGYYRALATAGYLINNATFPLQFGKRAGQIYLNTWHGTPLKKMGYDVENGGPHTYNVIRNFLAADYLVSGSDFMTRQMYESGYKLRGIYRGRIIQEGFPRTDRQHVTAEEALAVRQTLHQRGVVVDDAQQIILYAPTWKGDSFHRPDNDVEELRTRVRELTLRIDPRWRVLLRVHQQVYQYAIEDPELRDMLVPNDIPANVALGVSDVLVTDYSSIFYDFLATGRPVLFFVPELASYTSDRGLYSPPEQWPGPVTDSISTLAGHINGLHCGGEDDVTVSYAERYAAIAAQYCPYEDGTVTQRLVDVVFRQRTEGHRVLDDLAGGRESILVYLGGMRTNGITSAALNLLDNIDHDRFDVSAFYGYRSRNRDRLKNEAAIHPRVRLIPYAGGINGSKRFTLGRRKLLAEGLDARRIDVDRHRVLFQEEWNRVFGMSQFDYIVDFSGYGPFWPYLLREGRAKTHSIWLHSDMAADRMRRVGTRQPLKRGLGAVFSTYRHYDRLVSVSPVLSDINRASLTGFTTEDSKFVSAANTINYQRILRMAEEDPRDELREEEAAALAEAEQDEEPPTPELLERRAEAAADRAERYEILQRLMDPPAGMTTFVAVGRLSPEKNYARLIEAFAVLHRENPDTRLVLIGSGPLRAELEALVDSSGLAGPVIFAGQQNNPYALMKKADCFVLSSDYEGQPMVILEARVLGLPVISTDFASVRGSLPDGVGRVVARTVEGIANGMRELLRGAVPSPAFDYAQYNRDAVEQFYLAIGATVRNPVVPDVGAPVTARD